MRQLKRELWPFKVNLDVDDSRMKIDKVEQWLGDRVGAFRTNWNAVYKFNGTDYYFKKGEDATMFALTWAG